MSLASFFSSLWAHIKAMFGGLEPELKTAIHIGVVVTENLENFVASPEADIITALIPGDTDDKIKALLVAKLPTVLVELKLVDATVDLTDPAAITTNVLAIFSALDPSVKPAFLHSLSILVAQVAADGKLSWADGVYLLQWYYDNEYKIVATSSDITSQSEDNSLNTPV